MRSFCVFVCEHFVEVALYLCMVGPWWAGGGAATMLCNISMTQHKQHKHLKI